MNELVTFNICEGNPGALVFLINAYDKYIFKAEDAFRKLRDANITGDKLYIIWNDCCDRDTEKAICMILDNDIDTINNYINYEKGRGLTYNRGRKYDN